MITQDSKRGYRSHLTKLLLGSAMACLLAAPASATGWNYGGDVWSGPYVGVGVVGVAQDADVKSSARRDEVTNLEIACENYDGDMYPDSMTVCPVIPHKLGLSGDSSISATLFPLSQLHDQIASASDAGVGFVVTTGWDHRLAGSNFLLGALFNFDWFDTSAKFSSQTWAQGGKSSVEFEGDHPYVKRDSAVIAFLAGAALGSTIAHDIRDEHISINGKVEQDYALQLGGRMGYIWNEVFMTYGGAAWTRTKTKVSATIDIADPVCGSDFLCKEIGSPTQINLNKSSDTDGYKIFVGGEYNVGGNWFLQGQASYSDLNGLSNAFSGHKSQTLFSHDGGDCEYKSHSSSGKWICDPSIDLVREIEESASIDVDKKDYMIHAAVIYKFGGAAAPVAMK